MRSILVILMGLACGAVAAQGPEFIQQYTQRLGGWRDAYALQLSELDQRARKFGLSREDYIVALQYSDDPKARNEGNYLAKLPGYYETLNTAHEKLTAAPPWSRAFVFVEHYNGALAEQVWAQYKPAVPTNAEGAIYGGAGFVFGSLGIFLVGLPFRLVRGFRELSGKIGRPVARLRQRFSRKPKIN
jgi:hypothetical protein